MDDNQPGAEAKLRHNLGLSDEPKPSGAADPQRLARQAIRSQAAAREYAERQLLRAEQMIQDLSAKLHAVRSEKGAALEAARSPRAALALAERELRAATAALIGEKAANECAQRKAQEARATVHDLRTKLTLANQTVETLRAQLYEERHARTVAEQGGTATQTPIAAESSDASGDQPVTRRRGRPPGKRNASMSHPTAGKPHADNQKPVRWWRKGGTPNT